MIKEKKFFRALGKRIRELGKKRGLTQEDMISFGFSARHWQQIEAGRPIKVTTLLRVCAHGRPGLAGGISYTDGAISPAG